MQVITLHYCYSSSGRVYVHKQGKYNILYYTWNMIQFAQLISCFCMCVAKADYNSFGSCKLIFLRTRADQIVNIADHNKQLYIVVLVYSVSEPHHRRSKYACFLCFPSALVIFPTPLFLWLPLYRWCLPWLHALSLHRLSVCCKHNCWGSRLSFWKKCLCVRLAWFNPEFWCDF